jgi:PHD/YefM family antitoxin component YafN of YafNO toxin-antitoxin module
VITFESKDISRRSGDLLEAADHEPVEITRYKRPRYVLLRKDLYDHLVAHSTQTAHLSVAMPQEHRDLLGISTKDLQTGVE